MAPRRARWRHVAEIGRLALEELFVVLGQRHGPAPLVGPPTRGRRSPPAARRSLANTPAIFSPRATTQAPVSVATSTTTSGANARAAKAMASASIRRPSASVLPISTVRPAKVRTMSPGRADEPGEHVLGQRHHAHDVALELATGRPLRPRPRRPPPRPCRISSPRGTGRS